MRIINCEISCKELNHNDSFKKCYTMFIRLKKAVRAQARYQPVFSGINVVTISATPATMWKANTE